MGVLTDFFLATEAELRAHYPAWRVPLAEPKRAPMKNPFTGETVEAVVWDPEPDSPVEDPGPPGPPSPSIDMKGLGLTSVCSLLEIVCGGGKDVEERFYRLALIGPEEGPWINALPSPFAAKLASLDAAGLARVAASWTAVEQADLAGIENEPTRARMLASHDARHWREVLDELAAFARLAVAQGRDMYVWTSL